MERISTYIHHDSPQSKPMTFDKEASRDLRHIGVSSSVSHYRHRQPLFLWQRYVRHGSIVSLLSEASLM